MIEIKISETQIQAAVNEAIFSAVKIQLSDGYGAQGLLAMAIKAALNSAQADLQSVVKNAAIQALQSADLQEQLQVTFTKKIASLFVGEYEGTLKSIARKAAQDKSVEAAVATAVTIMRDACKNQA